MIQPHTRLEEVNWCNAIAPLWAEFRATDPWSHTNRADIVFGPSEFDRAIKGASPRVRNLMTSTSATAPCNSSSTYRMRSEKMKRLMFVGVAASLSCLGFTLRAQDSKSDDQAPLKVLAASEGVWDADITMTLPDPSGKIETHKSKGVETNRLLGGKWLLSDFKGEFFGMDFEGHGQIGYDTKKGKYVGTWVDTTSKQIDMLSGTYDEKTKTLTLNSEIENPADGKPMKMRLEIRTNDDGTRVTKEFVQMDGQKEFVQFREIKYTKRKK
jgi:Protein of unknown function (DUF1579)